LPSNLLVLTSRITDHSSRFRDSIAGLDENWLK
jgi:hypothetical protein